MAASMKPMNQIVFVFSLLLLGFPFHGRSSPADLQNSTVPAVVEVVRNLASKTASQDPIIITESNSRFHCMTVWWVENLKRLGIQHYLIVALDPKEYERLQELKYPTFWPNVQMDYKAAHFKSREFNDICIMRWNLIIDLLSHGIDLVLADVDVHWQKNPLPYFRELDSCDMYLSVGTKYVPDDGKDPKGAQILPPFSQKKMINYFNMGMAYLRSRPGVLELARKVVGDTKIRMDDQTIFNHHFQKVYDANRENSNTTHGLRNCAHYGNLTFHALRPDFFPHRLLYLQFPSFEQVYYTLHLNWLPNMNEKVSYMVRYGFMNKTQCPL